MLASSESPLFFLLFFSGREGDWLRVVESGQPVRGRASVVLVFPRRVSLLPSVRSLATLADLASCYSSPGFAKTPPRSSALPAVVPPSFEPPSPPSLPPPPLPTSLTPPPLPPPPLLPQPSSTSRITSSTVSVEPSSPSPRPNRGPRKLSPRADRVSFSARTTPSGSAESGSRKGDG